MKTHKGASKRFKLKGSVVIRGSSCKRHLQRNRNSNTKSASPRVCKMSDADSPRVKKKLLPHG